MGKIKENQKINRPDETINKLSTDRSNFRFHG